MARELQMPLMNILLIIQAKAKNSSYDICSHVTADMAGNGTF